jgi:perosamine synthetase
LLISMTSFIPLMVPDIQQKDIDAVVEVLKSGNLVQGIKVQQLEQSVARYVGTKHAVAVSNGTATLHLALLALGVGPGDEVIIPALSYIATANVVELTGAKPVFVDIDINTFNINPSLIEKAITPATKVIMPVHEFGLGCEMSEIVKIADKYGLKIIEDAACALGAKIDSRFAGSIGDFGSFSFHPRKAITSGEGGILVTNDDALASKIRILRNHGSEMINQKLEFTQAGFNYRMTDFQAALVSSQLKRLESILNKKNKLAEIYMHELSGVSQIKLPSFGPNDRHSWQSFHIVLDDSIHRDSMIDYLRDNGVGTNYGAQCMPSQKYYIDKYNLDCEKHYPQALRAYKQGLVLPLYPQMKIRDFKKITSLIKNRLNE